MEILRIRCCGNSEDSRLWKVGGFTGVEIGRIHGCGNSEDFLWSWSGDSIAGCGSIGLWMWIIYRIDNSLVYKENA